MGSKVSMIVVWYPPGRYIDAHAECHRRLALGCSVDADQALLERLRIVVDGLAGLDAILGLFQRRDQLCPLLVREHGDFFHCGDGTLVVRRRSSLVSGLVAMGAP